MKPEPRTGSFSHRTLWIASATVFVAAWLLRAVFLDDGFWIDEVQSVDTADHPWGRLFAQTGFADVHPPVYYALLKCWRFLMGTSDIAARLLSVCAGALTLGVFIHWARDRMSVAGTIVGALFLLTSTFHVHYSVEVRSYALFALFVLSWSLAVERWRLGGEKGEHFRLGIALLLAVAVALTHYYGLIVLAIVNLWLLLAADLTQARRMRWVAAQGVVIGVIAGWLPLLGVQLFDLPAGFTAHLSDTPSLTELLGAWGPAAAFPRAYVGAVAGATTLILAALGMARRGPVSGALEATASSLPSVRGWVVAGMLVILLGPLVTWTQLPLSETTFELFVGQLPFAYLLAVLAWVALWVLVRWRPARLTRMGGTLGAWLLIGSVLVIGLMQCFKPTLSIRNTLFLLPFIATFLGRFVTGRPRWVSVAFVLTVLMLAIPSLMRAQTGFEPRPDFRSVAKYSRDAFGSKRPPLFMLSRFDAGALAHYSEGDCRALPDYVYACGCISDSDCTQRIVGLEAVEKMPELKHGALVALSRHFISRRREVRAFLLNRYPDGAWQVGERAWRGVHTFIVRAKDP